MAWSPLIEALSLFVPYAFEDTNQQSSTYSCLFCNLLLYLFFNSPLYPPGFPGTSVGKESACNAGDPGSIPGSGRSSGEENGNPFQYACLGNPMGSLAGYSPCGRKRVGQDLATKPPPPQSPGELLNIPYHTPYQLNQIKQEKGPDVSNFFYFALHSPLP